MNKKILQGLYAITDPKLMGQDLISKIELAIFGGLKILQYRNKTASLEQQESEATALATLCKKNNVTFIINDNIELTIKVNADGVHLGQKDISIQQARKLLGDNKIIGITCNNKIELAQAAEKEGANYVAFGRFYPSQTKPNAPVAELTLLAEAKKTISIPIVAIGGITTDTAPELLKQGVDMLAVIQGIFGESDITAAAQQFVGFFPTSNAP